MGGQQRHSTRSDGLARSGGLLLIWLLLLIFVVYPLLMLLSRAFIDDGHFTVGALIAGLPVTSKPSETVSCWPGWLAWPER
jgi:hypothetical protein